MLDMQKEDQGSLALYGQFLGLSGLITAWLALLGWSYSENYFRLLGIPLSGSGVAASEMINYSAHVARRSWVHIGIALGIVAAIGFVLDFGLRRAMIKTAAFVAALGVIGVFGYASWIGADRARLDLATMRAEGFVGLPRALIILERVAAEDDRRAKALQTELSERGCYRILYMGGEILWAIRPRPQSADGSPSPEAPAVLGVRRGDVTTVRLLGHRPNCP